MSVRTELAAALKTRFNEKAYDYVLSHRGLGAIERPTLALAHKTFTRANVNAHTIDAGITLLVVVPTKDIDAAEDELDAEVAGLLVWLDREGPRAVRWTEALRTTEEGYSGWDITLRVLTDTKTITESTDSEE